MDPGVGRDEPGARSANPGGTLRSRTRKIGGGRTAPRPAVHAGNARPADLLLDRAHRPVRDLVERLRDGRQGRVSQARQHEIVEAGHRNVLGHAPALLAQDIDGAGRHLVVRRHDAVDLHAAREDLLHGHLGRVGAEVARGDQGRIESDAMACQHRSDRRRNEPSLPGSPGFPPETRSCDGRDRGRGARPPPPCRADCRAPGSERRAARCRCCTSWRARIARRASRRRSGHSRSTAATRRR